MESAISAKTVSFLSAFLPTGDYREAVSTYTVLVSRVVVTEVRPRLEISSSSRGQSRFPEHPTDTCEQVARFGFLALEKAWQLQGKELAKAQFDFQGQQDGKGMAACRVVQTLSGQSPEAFGAACIERFAIPTQRIILWRGSSADDFGPLINAAPFFRENIVQVTCSAHKEPMRAAQTAQQLQFQHPDSVIVALVGKSNAAGPVLAAAVTLPVITVPATADTFPDDVWSSLRMPSEVPLMTVLSPANAMLAALNILSARNPVVYATLRNKIEQRLENYRKC